MSTHPEVPGGPGRPGGAGGTGGAGGAAAPGAVRSARLRRLAVVVPLMVGIAVEVTTFWAVASWIGVAATVLLVLGCTVLGGVLVGREGRRSVRRVVDVLRSGGVPTAEIADGVVGVLSAVLVLVPGLVGSAVGLVLYVARPLLRRPAQAFLARRARRTGGPTGSWGVAGMPGFPGFPGAAPGGRRGGPDVVTGEVVDDDRER